MQRKHVTLSLCKDLLVNPKMNLNPLQITPSLTLTQLLSETHIFLFSVTLMQTEGWYPLGKTTCEGNRIDGYTSQFGLKQLLHEPINITRERSPCIDLIFASQTNLVMELGAQSSSHQNCHHQIVLARFNLKLVFPPPYERDVWHFQKANIDHIRKGITGLQSEKSFQNMNVKNMVHLFNKTIKNILHNFISHKIITCNDSDPT